jgi:uncharacterized membrane protein required for colicin V production
MSVQVQREKKTAAAPVLDANFARRLPLRVLLADDNPINYVRELAQQTIEVRWIGDVVALLLVFAVPLIAFKTVASVLSDHVSEGGFGMADRLVGMAFGIARGAVVACALYLGFGFMVAPDEQPAWITQATLLPYVQDGAELLQDLLPADAEEAGRRAVNEARREVGRELTTP